MPGFNVNDEKNHREVDAEDDAAQPGFVNQNQLFALPDLPLIVFDYELQRLPDLPPNPAFVPVDADADDDDDDLPPLPLVLNRQNAVIGAGAVRDLIHGPPGHPRR
jgi:hypothetical protein